MKLTIAEALDLVSKQAVEAAPPAPSYTGVWLRAEYRRRQTRQARLGLLQAVALAAIATVELIVLLVWEGAWVREDALQRLGAMIANGAGALDVQVPVAVVLGLAMIAWALVEDPVRTE